jgi:hypothetical protein
MIAQRFTLGQLALIAWHLQRRAARPADSGSGEEIDLRQLTGAELALHLARLGA